MSKINSLIIVLFTMLIFSLSIISQPSHRKMVRDYERKIFEKENAWRLTKRFATDIGSENAWTSDNGFIVVNIHKFSSSEEALNVLHASRTNLAAGGVREFKGFADAAYEHFGQGGLFRGLYFVKGDSMVTIDRDPIGKVEIPVVHRFAKHVLDAMEGK